jgi:hypothetical protein
MQHKQTAVDFIDNGSLEQFSIRDIGVHLIKIQNVHLKHF